MFMVSLRPALEALRRGEHRVARLALKKAERDFSAAGDVPNTAWALLLSARAAEQGGEGRMIAKLLDRARRAARSGSHLQIEAMVALAEAEHAAKSLAIGDAHVAASRAWAAAHRAGNAMLAKEVELFEAALAKPVAHTHDGEKLDLAAIAEKIRAPNVLVLDARRNAVFCRGLQIVDLASRPLAFDLLALLAERSTRTVAVRASNVVELRAHVRLLRKLAGAKLGPFVFEGKTLAWEASARPVVIVPIAPRVEARLESILSDGRAWSVSALAKGLGEPDRAIMRGLRALEKRGVVSSLDPSPKKLAKKRWELASPVARLCYSELR